MDRSYLIQLANSSVGINTLPQDPLTVAIPPIGTQPPALTSPSSIGIGKLSMHSRHHSLGTNPSMHRVTRRKSVSSTATNLAAVAQAVKEGTDVQLTLPPPNTSILSRSVGRSVGMGLSAGSHSPHNSLAPMHGYPSPPPSLPNNGGTSPLLGAGSLPASGFTFPRKVPVPTSPAPVNGGISSAAASNSVTSSNRRVRRASEGAHVLLGGESSEEKVRGKGGVELKCDKCGKGYKHSSCLTKHLFVSPSLCFVGLLRTETLYPVLPSLLAVVAMEQSIDTKWDPFLISRQCITLLSVLLQSLCSNKCDLLEYLCRAS